MSDQDFEHRFAQLLGDYAEQGVRPFDAVEIAHTAATTRSRAGAVVARQRRAAPAWMRSLVLAGLLVVTLIAVAFAGGMLRLPTGLLEPSGSPTETSASPDPSATVGPGETPLPTVISGLTPDPNATEGPSPFPGLTPLPGLTPSPGPTDGPPATTPPPGPTIEPSPEPTLEPEPTAEPASTVVTIVDAGDTHSCGIRNDRTIACWGWNGNGELGDGTIGESWVWPAVTVSGIPNAVAISAGNRFSCAVRANGSVWCWGEGGAGQLGNGAQDDSATPVRVSGISDAVDVTTGAAHACALRSGGSIACWGLGQLGQLGNGSVIHNTGNPTPVTVSEINDATAIFAGWNHTCALRPDGSVWCWGGNGDGATGYGQIGDGSLDNRPSPVAVTGISNATRIAAGGWSTCALLNDRSVRCWGYNERGGLGNGTTANSSVPVAVSGVDDAVRIAVGGWHACALRASGSIACWGANSDGGSGFGQLGSGDRQDSSVPVPVAGIGDATRINAAWISTCAIRQGGAVWCWGPGSGMEGPWQIPVPPAGL